MTTIFFQSIGYVYCGYWKRLEKQKGSVKNPLWLEFIDEEKKHANISGPLTYIWIANDQIIYVGETSQSVKQRMTKGHIGGFRGGSKSGIEKQKMLLALKAERIDIYACHEPFFSKYIGNNIKTHFTSDFNALIPPLNEDMHSSRHIEEKLLIAIFKPILNKR